MKKKLDRLHGYIVTYNSSSRRGPLELIALQLNAPANDRGPRAKKRDEILRGE
jgi:hypothetical protein